MSLDCVTDKFWTRGVMLLYVLISCVPLLWHVGEVHLFLFYMVISFSLRVNPQYSITAAPPKDITVIISFVNLFVTLCSHAPPSPSSKNHHPKSFYRSGCKHGQAHVYLCQLGRQSNPRVVVPGGPAHLWAASPSPSALNLSSWWHLLFLLPPQELELGHCFR